MADPGHVAVVRGFAEAVTSEGELVSESLEDADFGTFKEEGAADEKRTE